MKTIKRSIKISSSQNNVFEITQNYNVRLEWDSYLNEARLLGKSQSAGIGEESYCRNKLGMIMVSKYIFYNSPDVAAVKMTKGPRVLKKFSGAWNVKSIGIGESLVTFTDPCRQIRTVKLGRV
ncbi:hypothetical protein [Psychrobacter sp.]|uniref:hypothetical protein n=1 Tax=Psychrobacter sp. TaxID=56811 RepID=UPI003BAFB152